VPTNIEKLRGLLQELFQLDQADLDFGIYRIMNQKRDEIVRFLDNDLLPQVKEAFTQYKSADKSEFQKELDKLIQSITAAGMNPEDSPKVKELRQKIAESGVDIAALEDDVFSHLFKFFRRYYNEGDFLSLRRYKEGVYAIPYEGEEVKFHWANSDQYYVKSSEYFRDYIFTTSSGKRVRVHLVAVSTEQDNKKEAPGLERRFILRNENPISEEGGELFIHFEYRASEGKEKQESLNQAAIQRILTAPGLDEWIAELSRPAPTDKNKNRTLLEKHLTQYTAKNTFDYFIHKDLGGFLRRELDFYIKNEVMHLDDIEDAHVPRVEQYLSEIKIIRSISYKIIAFLEQLENFQKNLWLKKKFIVETNYCITLDRIAKELYQIILANNPQREEWVRLFAIDSLPGYSTPLTVEFLKANDKLLVDTRFFDAMFKNKLLASINSLDDQCNGLLIHADNFQALNLIHSRFQEQVKCIYIDPP
jgi:adenine-specific DNA-methyltransferase